MEPQNRDNATPPGWSPSILGDESISREEMGRLVEALYYVHRLVSNMTDIDMLLTSITEESKKVARAEASSVILYSAEQDDLYFHVALGESGDQDRLKREIRLQLGQGIAGVAAQTRQSILVGDAQQDPRFFRGADDTAGFQTRNLLATPMMDRNTLVGVLEVINKQDGDTFTPLDQHALEMFASLAASAVINARLLEEQIRTARLTAIGRAMAGLSHYTKNILAGLNTSVELIDMGIDQQRVDVLQKSWPIFKRSTKRMSNFVLDMLSFSKPREPNLEDCDVRAMIDEVHEAFTDLFAQRNIRVVLDFSGLHQTVKADPEGMFRVLLNLFINAADAVPAENGEITLSASTEQDGGLRLRLSDNGPGIPESILSRIFEPFYSTKGYEGTGLGLAVAKKIIEEHHGTIGAGNRPGGGAVFNITLPRTPHQEEGVYYI